MTVSPAYQKQFAEALRRWQSQIDALAGRKDSVDPRELIEFERQMDLLFAKKNLATDRLQQLATAASETEREMLKSSLDGIENEIENALDSAWAKLSS